MNDKILFVDDKWKEDEWDIEFKKRMPKEWEFIYEKRGDNALQQIKINPDIKVVLLDLNFEGQQKQGEEVLKDINNSFPAMPVIIMTAHNDVPTARKLCWDGKMASQYFVKGKIDYEQLRLEINRCIELYNLETDNIRRTDSGHIIGKSKAILDILQRIKNVCKHDVTVLITGESGTGKELIARSIHQNSKRNDYPFIAENCGAFSKELAESKLFGHVKGAFTGAVNDTKGCFELANGGTIFLDEIGELEKDIQVKLLRVLQQMEFTRVGGEKITSVDVRIITATNKNLQEAVKEGSFREDLYYRLNVVHINIPPLRVRKEDIPLLVKYLINRLNYKHKMRKEVDTETMELFSSYDWPGNIRELENALESAMLNSSLNILGKECFSFFNQPSDKKDDEDTEDNIWAEKLILGEKKWEDLKSKFKTEQQDRILNKAKEFAIEKKLVSRRGVINWLADHIEIHRTALSNRIGEKRRAQQESNSLEKENVS